MKKLEFIKLIRECIREEEQANPNDPMAILGGGAESDEEEISIKNDVIKQIDIALSEYQGGEKIEKSEISHAAEEEQMDANRLRVSDILFERIKNVFYNHQQMKAVTYMGTNSPAVKDAIINKLGENNNPIAMEVIVTGGAKGVQRYPRDPNAQDMTDDEMDKLTAPEPGEETEEEPEEEEGPTTDQLTEKIKNSLKKLIRESIEEVKVEKEEESVEVMEGLLKEVLKHSKSAEIVQTPRGNFFVENCGNHHFDIRPMWEGNYDVVYMKNKADREKKFNLDSKELKEYVINKLTNEGSYVGGAFNKNAANQKDQVKEVSELPKSDKVKAKTVTDTKNENKDFNQKAVLNEEDQPDKPMVSVKKVVKQVDHPIAGEKTKFTPPKQDKKEKAHLVKLKNKKLKA